VEDGGGETKLLQNRGEKDDGGGDPVGILQKNGEGIVRAAGTSRGKSGNGALGLKERKILGAGDNGAKRS